MLNSAKIIPADQRKCAISEKIRRTEYDMTMFMPE